MPGCTSPLDAWPASTDAADRRPVFASQRSYAGAVPFGLPCGQCLNCRRAHGREWATRISNEATMHPPGSCWFGTLTYNEQNLPRDLGLSVVDTQLFMKRFRHHFGPVRFFICGEYGTQTRRPHYHFVLFGVDFPDKHYWRAIKQSIYYRSPSLEKVWPKGNSEFCALTPGAASYIAGYVTKKITGDAADENYRRIATDPATGKVREWRVHPEFSTKSLQPGLGSTWFDEFAGDAFPSDFLILDGRKVPVPGYYLDKLPEDVRLRIVAARKLSAVAATREGRETFEATGRQPEQSVRRMMTRHESAILRDRQTERDVDLDNG